MVHFAVIVERCEGNKLYRDQADTTSPAHNRRNGEFKPLAGCSCLLFLRWPGGQKKSHAAETKYQVSSIMFTGSLSQVVLAITNAFGNGAYHGMKLGEDRVDYVLKEWKGD
jgi:hypothetical protein